MTDEIRIPFSEQQIQDLNEWQTGTGMHVTGHPFTCINNRDEFHRVDGLSESVLIATRDGWVCPCCDYTQHWAHSMMLASPLPDWVTHDMRQERDALTKAFAAKEIVVYRHLAKSGAAGASQMVQCLEQVISRQCQTKP